MTSMSRRTIESGDFNPMLPRLRVNKFGSRPPRGQVGTFDGFVAAPGLASFSVITSPNQDSVPEFAIAHAQITTFDDGLWGKHEYSRWPQSYDRGQIHVACIPRRSCDLAPKDEILWRKWYAGDWTMKDVGVNRCGQLQPSLMHELDRAAERMIEEVQLLEDSHDSTRRIRVVLTTCLRHCLDRLRLLPAERGIIVSLAAHAQRLTLELAGLATYIRVVRPRIESKLDHRHNILGVLGALTHDPSVAQMLHWSGVPVWFQQQYSDKIAVWQVVPHSPPPIQFSNIPSYPRLVLALRDLSGALNTPGEWARAMKEITNRQLCASRLPGLLREAETETDPQRSAKRVRIAEEAVNKWSSSLGSGHPVYLVRNSAEAKTLGHGLPVTPGPRPQNQSRAANRKPGPDRGEASKFVMNPFRQYYPSLTMEHPPAWSRALAVIGPLPQPAASVTYFFPPPFLLDRLDGYVTPEERRTRYLHHFLSIAAFCRVRLFDRTVAGRPLTIAEWRDSLFGDYTLDVSAPEASGSQSAPARGKKRAKVRHELRQSLRELFGKLATLPSYDPAKQPMVGSLPVKLEMLSAGSELEHRIIWEVYETNFRAELLALDALVVGSDSWPEMERWMREAHVSEVWGPSRSGLSLWLDLERSSPVFCWASDRDQGWESCRTYLQAFVTLLLRWPGCPPELQVASGRLSECGVVEFQRAQDIAVEFYVRVFVAKYQRLPTPPVRSRVPLAPCAAESSKLPTDHLPIPSDPSAVEQSPGTA